VGNYIPLGEHASVEITGQIFQSGISLSGEPAIHYPIFEINRRVKTESQLFQTGKELSPEQPVQYPLGEQEPVAGMDTQSLLRLVSNTRNHEVNMGMEIQSSAMGVQDSGKADKTTEEPWI